MVQVFVCNDSKAFEAAVWHGVCRCVLCDVFVECRSLCLAKVSKAHTQWSSPRLIVDDLPPRGTARAGALGFIRDAAVVAVTSLNLDASAEDAVGFTRDDSFLPATDCFIV